MDDSRVRERLISLIEEDEKKVKSTCDDAFALFLVEISKKVAPKLYKIFLIFIRYYRECMNKLGWEIINQYKDLEDEPTYLDFCTVKKPEYLPQIVNDFVGGFLFKQCPNFDKNLVIVMVSHFCYWLYQNQYTHMKINLAKDTSTLIK